MTQICITEKEDHFRVVRTKCRFYSLPNLIPSDDVRPAGRVQSQYAIVVLFTR